MIKAIIFDYFGVIVSEGVTSFLDNFCPANSTKRKESMKLIDDYDKNSAITYDEFLEQLAQIAGTTKDVAEKYLDNDCPNKSLINYIRTELKPHYKVGILSNSAQDWVSEELDPEDVKIFDEIVLSYKYKLIKPHPEIFELMANKLGVELSECVMVDDQMRHCDGARAVGMQAIQYKDFTQLKTDLEKLLGSFEN